MVYTHVYTMYIGQADVDSLQYHHMSVVYMYMYSIHVQYTCVTSVTAPPSVAHALLVTVICKLEIQFLLSRPLPFALTTLGSLHVYYIYMYHEIHITCLVHHPALVYTQ